MSDANRYREYARACVEHAKAAQSPIDREIWLRMEFAWLRLAYEEDLREPVAAAA